MSRRLTEMTEESEDLHETRTATNVVSKLFCKVLVLVLTELFVNKD